MKEKKSFIKAFVIGGIFLGIILFLGVITIFILSFSLKKTDMSESFRNSLVYTDEVSFKSPLVPDIGGELYLSDGGFDSMEYAIEDKKLIKTAQIDIRVDDIDNTLDEISKLTISFKGTTMDLDDFGKGLDRTVFMKIRVEEDDFESFYNKIKELDGEFVGSTISQTDVTETVVDLKTRLNNYRNVEAQFLKILESAESVEDTLSVYKEINKVRLDIEGIEVQLKNLETQTDYSYININIFQSSEGAELEEEEWKPVGILKDAARSLLVFLRFIGSVLIWLVVFSPVITLFVVPIAIIQKKRKK
jgi:hypothetical protein